MTELDPLLQVLLDRRGSDLHLKVGSPPFVRVDGHLGPVERPPLSAPDLEALAKQVLPPHRANEFGAVGEVDFAHSVPGLGRFRVNLHRQRGSFGMVVRKVQPGMPSFESLGLPLVVRRLADEARGLVIVAGPAGSGRSTTAAMLVDHINETRVANIVTIEDPIEVLHPDKRSIVSQREVGSDVRSFADGMNRVLRHDPDVVFVGELRDAETTEAALAAANTGRLVLTTMATATAADTLTRVVEFFAPAAHRQVRQTLAACLRGVACQRLIERADGRGRIPAVETLLMTPKVFDVIVDGARLADVEHLIAEGEYHGMQTVDQSLYRLCRDGLIGAREAVGNATRPEDLRILLQSGGMGR